MDTRTGLPVVGMVGGGQLARMTHQAAIALGQSLRILATSPEDGAALVAADVHVGAPTDLDALTRFAKGCDVVTFDHEHVPGAHIRALAAAGVTVYPSADALHYAQDKAAMRERLGALGAAGAPVAAGRHRRRAGRLRRRGGLAGGGEGGQRWLRRARGVGGLRSRRRSRRSARRRYPATGRGAGAAAPGAGGAGGAFAVRPGGGVPGGGDRAVGRDLRRGDRPRPRAQRRPGHRRSSSSRSGSPPSSTWSACSPWSCSRPSAGVVVNELAMRPHNSGHWTIEGARTSQFEQHLRAVLDYPLGECHLTAPVVVMANLLGTAERVGGQSLDERLHHLFAAEPGVKVHLYGKQVRARAQDRACHRAR